MFHSPGRTGPVIIAVLGPIDALIAVPEVISKCWILFVSGTLCIQCSVGVNFCLVCLHPSWDEASFK